MKYKILFIIIPAIISMVMAGLIGYSCGNKPVDKESIMPDIKTIPSYVGSQYATNDSTKEWEKQEILEKEKLCKERGHVLDEVSPLYNGLNPVMDYPIVIDSTTYSLKITAERIKIPLYCIRCISIIDDGLKYDTTIVWRKK